MATLTPGSQCYFFHTSSLFRIRLSCSQHPSLPPTLFTSLCLFVSPTQILSLPFIVFVSRSIKLLTHVNTCISSFGADLAFKVSHEQNKVS